MKTTSRRQFVKTGACLTAGALLALNAPGIMEPAAAQAKKISFPEAVCGPDQAGNGRILVGYASMHGTTGDVARAVAERICAKGFQADVRLLKKVKDVSPYRGFVIGSAIRTDRWLTEAEEFVAAHRKELSRFPTAYFLTCLTLSKPGEGPLKKAQTFLDPVISRVPEVSPVAVGLFAGVLDYSLLSVGMGAVMRYKMWAKDVKEGDYRDWNAIGTWSEGLPYMADGHSGKEAG